MSDLLRERMWASLVAVLIGFAFAGYGLEMIPRPDLWLWLVTGTVFVLTGVAGWLLGNRRPGFHLPAFVGALLIALCTLTPVMWLISLSLKHGPADVRSTQFLPLDPTWANYRTVVQLDLFQRALINSFGIALISTAISVALATFAAYAIARLDFTGRKFVPALALSVAMFPMVALVGPLSDMWRRFGIYDTWIGLIIAYLAITVPIATLVLSAIFRQVPWGVQEAARVDGATSWQALRRVLVPLAAPGIAAATIITFLCAWTDFVFGISLGATTRSLPLPASLALLRGTPQLDTPAASIAAAAVVATVPVVILVAVFQRKIVAGLTSGMVKG